jgi:hypothetical protein
MVNHVLTNHDQVAMIVSNKHVMLIDPSRQHITSEKKVASRRMTLQTARQYVLFVVHNASVLNATINIACIRNIYAR